MNHESRVVISNPAMYGNSLSQVKVSGVSIQ